MNDRPRVGMPPPVPRALARTRMQALGGEPVPGSAIPRTALSAVPEDSAFSSTEGESGAKAPNKTIGDVSARKWDEVFDERMMVTTSGGEFCCYLSRIHASCGVVCMFLHGGGHGALSWGSVARLVSQECGVIAFDARGHGDSRSEDESDLSSKTQVADASAVIRALFAKLGMEIPRLVICGHSMGGAIAVRLAASSLMAEYVKGLIVVDVVEGTALSALPNMLAWVRKRKQQFSSVEKAVRYVINAGHVQNVESARLSVPQQVYLPPGSNRWVWRTPLENSEPYWRGWFEGLSQLFLSVRAAKMLVLAGADRLDKDLMIGQMQGKFQYTVLPGVGHVVHEDEPEQTAQVILNFLRRNMFIDGAALDEPQMFQQRAPIAPRW